MWPFSYFKSNKEDKTPSEKKKFNFTASCVRTNKDSTYIGTYTFSHPFGLVKVKCHDTDTKESLYPNRLLVDKKKDFDIKINRVISKTNDIVIECTLDKNIFEIVDEAYPEQKTWHENHHPETSYYRTYNKLWLPWVDNAKDIEHYGEAEQNKFIRGGNRINIDFMYPGSYVITVPDDVDLIVDVIDGNIYNSCGFGNIHIEAPEVNRYGDNGSSTPDGQSWDYYGDDKKGFTKLSVKKGKINV
jgi:hypothetical protein